MTRKDEFCSTPEGKQSFYYEKTMLSLTESVCEAMEKSGFNRESLSFLMAKPMTRIDDMLDGKYDAATILNLSAALTIMGYELDIKLKAIE